MQSNFRLAFKKGNQIQIVELEGRETHYWTSNILIESHGGIVVRKLDQDLDNPGSNSLSAINKAFLGQ